LNCDNSRTAVAKKLGSLFNPIAVLQIMSAVLAVLLSDTKQELLSY